MDIETMLAGTRAETVELRRDFHRHPELGLREFRTGDTVAAYLEACGLEVSRLNGTGVSGLLRGDPAGPTLLLRADMDALPIMKRPACPLDPRVTG